MSTSIPPVPPSYYENFIESLAQIVSKLLTDKETEAVLKSIRSFQERLNRLSSQNLSRLNLEVSSSRPPSQPSICKHEGKTCSQNCSRGFIKAYVVAFVVKYLIGVLPLLLTGKIFKKPNLLKRLAGNTFLSSYKGILCMMRRLRGTTDAASDRLNAFVAGAVAGLSLVIDPDRRRRQSIMMYLLTRSLQFSGGWLMGQWSKARQAKRQATLMQLRDRPTWEDVFAKGLQRYAGALVMMLANVQIIYGFLFNPDTLTKSYHSFLLYHSGWKDDFGNMAIPLTHAINDTVHRMAQGDDEAVPFRIPEDTTSRDFVAQHVSPNVASIIPHNIRHRYAVCALQHPLDASCTRSKLTLFRDGYGRALKLYVPLNVVR
ncbi:hypothetical protein BCR42DRAFT_327906 [Absidia repens]|uniref:Transmembrane protein 135 N-terminal domain-containing protein n=1 Tax=Absidia repens TaxID=90262 RepID=A0A1X2IGD2_9FUNG|nr:hypothetical protein BCR42DRAFT_327906 [Absidia repens]